MGEINNEKSREDLALDVLDEAYEEDPAKFLGSAFGGALFNLEEQAKRKNVAIFVDYDNVYWTLIKKYRHDPDNKNARKNLFVRLWEHYGRDNVRTFRAYADYQQIQADLTSLQKKRVQIRHVYSNGKIDDLRKNASDIELSIDVIESTHREPNISCYAIVTADSDMIPILSRLMYKGKRVELFYVGSAVSRHTNITSYAHEHYDLLEFLEVDVKEYNPLDYIEQAVEYIYSWHMNPSNQDFSLGRRWLNGNLVNHLGVPEETVSQLIDLMEQEGYIKEEFKVTSKGNYRNIVLNIENGAVKGILQQYREIATDKE